MKNSVISLAKNGFVVVNEEHAEHVRTMAERVGVCACGGALVARVGGGFDKVLYTEQHAPAWVALVEALERDKWVEIAQEERENFACVCEVLGICVHGGAIVERDEEMLQGYYVE